MSKFNGKRTKRIEVTDPQWFEGRKIVALIVEWNDGDHKAHIDRIKNLPKYTVPVKRISSSGEEKTFASLSEASRITGIAKNSISRAINGKQIHAGGYRWKRLKE